MGKKKEAKNGSTAKYSPAGQAEPMDYEVRDVHPDKQKKTCCQKCALYSCFIGMTFIVAAIVCGIALKPAIENIIMSMLPIREGTVVYQGWKAPPVTPVLLFRVFNLTNERRFLAGLEKPKLEEVGPYAYRQVLTKEDVTFSQGGDAVRYTAKRIFQFAPEISNGTEEDLVVVPNIPLLGAMKATKPQGEYAASVFKSILSSYDFAPDVNPFLTMTLKEFLWGYDSVLLSIDMLRKGKLEGCESKSKKEETKSKPNFNDDDDEDDEWSFGDSDDDWGGLGGDDYDDGAECEITKDNMAKFGLYMGRNLTKLDPRTVYTGHTDLEQKGFMVAWHDKTELDYWSEDHCNSLDAVRAPGGFPLDIDKSDVYRVFLGQLCRTINFKYKKEVMHDKFLTYRFVPEENTLDSPSDNPSNECFCVDKRNCLPSGLHDVSACHPGSPVMLSWPHFMYGDPKLRRGVEGMNPDEEKHSFVFDIEPDYGISLAAMARLQLNVIIEKNSGGFGYFDNINADQVVLPFAWLEEGVQGPSDSIKEKVTKLLTAPQKYPKLIGFLIMLAGLAMLIPEIFFWIRSCF